MASEDDVRELALSLPETIEKSSYGTPGFRVKDKLFARIHEEGHLILFCENLDQKEALLEAEPDKFLTTPHYDGHAMILVRLEAVDRDELLDLLDDSWQIRAPKRLRRTD